ncbi:MAG TPA: ABC transporter ATP-binding protein [Acetobacteraceae bacterium]|jgi:branched-chain amino acid transport system ATP-binding protein|nr:ABC transporter ATP-binding protein [Acetobacteraceae bacterium]
MLEVEGLTVAYGRTVAVHALDLHVTEAQVVALIGANGAGKTTTLRALSGLLRPRAGRVQLDGRDVAGRPGHRIAALGMRLVPEGRQIFAELTVEENLSLGAWLTRDGGEIARRRQSVLARFPRLRERLRQRAGSMSGGEQQMLAIGRALMGAPRVLLLDEPSMGLAPLFVEEIFRIVAALKDEGTTILLVEQNASAALEIADEAYVLEGGRVVMHGPASTVANDPAIVAAYL